MNSTKSCRRSLVKRDLRPVRARRIFLEPLESRLCLADGVVPYIIDGVQAPFRQEVALVSSGGTGTFISRQDVLTAAHVVDRNNDFRYTSADGPIDVYTHRNANVFSQGFDKYKVVGVSVHPNYQIIRYPDGRFRYAINDVAVLHLETFVDDVVPVPLMRSAPPTNVVMEVVGFGQIRSTTNPNQVAESNGVRYWGQVVLDQVRGGGNIEHPNSLSWDFDQQYESTTAPGDSGGPGFLKLNNQKLLAGVTSSGPTAPLTVGGRAHSMRVDVFAPWIDAQVAAFGSTGPAATVLSRHDITTPTSSGSVVQIEYTDANGLQNLDFHTPHIALTGPNNYYNQYPRLGLTSWSPDRTKAVVDYYFAGPGGTWSPKDNGQYQVNLLNRVVRDALGNPTGATMLTTLNVTLASDTTAPTTTFLGENIANGKPNYIAAVTYSDPGSGINSRTFGNDDVRLVRANGTTVGYGRAMISNTIRNGSAVQQVYEFTAPGGSWDSTDNGTYSVVLQAGAVRDVAGNGVAGGVIGTLTVNLTGGAPISPWAVLSAPDMPIGTTTHQFTITYRDDSAVSVASIQADKNIVWVEAANRLGAWARLVSVSPAANNSTIVATYRYTTNAFSATDNGVPITVEWFVDFGATRVTDTQGNTVPGRFLGGFQVRSAAGPPNTTAPQAAISASNITLGGAHSQLFSAVFSDDVAVSAPTISSESLYVLGPNGQEIPLVISEINYGQDDPQVSATFGFEPPGGEWDPADNGAYEVRIRDGVVSDLEGNLLSGFIANGQPFALGGFLVDISNQTEPPALAPEIDLRGNNTPIASGDATPSADDHTDFGSVNTASGTVQRTFTIANTGQADLNLTDSPLIRITGANAAEFAVTILSETLIAAGQSATFQITFDPAEFGLRSAVVSIASDDEDENPYTFTVQGTGSDGDVGGTIPTAFDTLLNGPGHFDWTELIGSNFSGDIDLYRISAAAGDWVTAETHVPNGGFEFDTMLRLFNAAGEQLELDDDSGMGVLSLIDRFLIPTTGVYYLGVSGYPNWAYDAMTGFNSQGGATGQYSLSIDVARPAPEFDLFGNNTPIASGDTIPSAADHTDFGATSTDGGAIHRIFTIANNGPGNLNLTDSPRIRITGANAADFFVTALPQALIATGQSATFQITFDPASFGLRTAVVSIANDDPNENPYTFAVQGTGRQPITSLTFEAETHFGHQIGRAEGDGWVANTATDSAAYLTFGPYTNLLDPGLYTANFRMRTNGAASAATAVVTIDAWDAQAGRLLAKRTIRGGDFIAPNVYQDFALDFEVANPAALLEFRAFWLDTADVKLDRVQVVPRAAMIFEAETSLAHQVGRADGDGWVAVAATDAAGYLMFGPYTTDVSPGLYSAIFRLQAGLGSGPSAPVATIDVFDAQANRLVAKRILRGGDFDATNVYQDFALDFESLNPNAALEFRTNWHDTADVKIDRVRIAPQVVPQYEAETDLGHLVGRADGDGWSVLAAVDQASYLSFGPYTPEIEPGLYTAVYRLQSNRAAAPTTPVVTIDVWDANAGQLVAQRTLFGAAFDTAYAYRDFGLDVEITNPAALLEFRTFWHGTADVKQDRVRVLPRDAISFEAETDLPHQIGFSAGDAWVAVAAFESAGYLSFGPYTTEVSTGAQAAVFRLQTDGAAAATTPVVTIDVYDFQAGQLLAQRTLVGGDFSAAYTYQDFALELEVTNPSARLEFRTLWHDTADVMLDRIRVFARDVARFEAETDLAHQVGQAETDGWKATAATDAAAYLAFGPYTTEIDPGAYTALYRLRSSAAPPAAAVVTIDVWDAQAGRMIAQRTLRGSDFVGSNYQDFELDFEVTNPDALLEFRVFWHDTAEVKLDRVRILDEIFAGNQI